MIDPVWSDRASPVSFTGPRRSNPPGITFDDMPPIDVVLISHGHPSAGQPSAGSMIRACPDTRMDSPWPGEISA